MFLMVLYISLVSSTQQASTSTSTSYPGLGPVRYMTISAHRPTTSVQVFRQIRNLDHFGTLSH